MSGKRYCGIPACINNLGIVDINFPFFKKPHSSSINARAKWDYAVKTLYGININHMSGSVCGLHFQPDDFTSKKDAALNRIIHRLKLGRVPSVPLTILTIKTEPEPEPAQFGIHNEITFDYVEVESIKNNVTEVKNNVSDQLMDVNSDNDNVGTTCNTCDQCTKYCNEMNKLISANESIQKKCEELLRENRSLKTQLSKSVGKNANGKRKKDMEQCEVCSEWLIKDGHLCAGANEIRCEYCSASFSTIADFSVHLVESKHPKMKMYKCESCVMGFPTAALVKFHQESQYTHPVPSAIDEEMDISFVEKIFKCSTCNSCFQQSNELKEHIKSHLKPPILHGRDRRRAKEFECYICKIETDTKAEMKSHLKEHVAARNKKCVICEESLTSKEMNEHLCYGQKTISCEYCSRSSFSLTSELVQHLETHDDRTMRRCSKCYRFFAMNILVLLHEKHHETAQPRSIICEICSKGFCNKIRLRMHMKCHQIARNFLCSTCGKGFKDKPALIHHTQNHSTKQFQCADCPFATHNRQLLHLHRDIHTNVKYKCNQCNAVLSSKASLRSHIKSKHCKTEKVKKFECSFCSLKFAASSTLKKHLGTHTGEKPFVCETCPDQRYAHKYDLIRHIQKQHLGHDNIYECDLCDEKFSKKWQFNRHSFIHYKPHQT